ncbi:MAG: hypothetical protein NT027_16760, partial [Proteobacteria bacterium]|nr:hypothetical protein [Pseudomonadota bacterium]
ILYGFLTLISGNNPLQAQSIEDSEIQKIRCFSASNNSDVSTDASGDIVIERNQNGVKAFQVGRPETSFTCKQSSESIDCRIVNTNQFPELARSYTLKLLLIHRGHQTFFRTITVASSLGGGGAGAGPIRFTATKDSFFLVINVRHFGQKKSAPGLPDADVIQSFSKSIKHY